MHHSTPPSNAQEYGFDTDLLELSPSGLVLFGSQYKGELASQLHGLSCEPPRAIPYEVAASGLGPVKPLLGLIGDASPGSIPQGMLTVPLVLKPSPI